MIWKNLVSHDQRLRLIMTPIYKDKREKEIFYYIRNAKF